MSLPIELWADIFSRLDLTSWTQAQLVCRSWCDIANYSKRIVQTRKESRWGNYSMNDVIIWAENADMPPFQYLFSAKAAAAAAAAAPFTLLSNAHLYNIVGIAFDAANAAGNVAGNAAAQKQQNYLDIVMMAKDFCDNNKHIVIEGNTERFFKQTLFLASGKGNLNVLKAMHKKLNVLCFCFANSAAQEGHLNTLRWLVEEKKCLPHGHNFFTLACSRGHYQTVSYLCQKLHFVPLERDMEVACAHNKITIVMLFVILRVPFPTHIRHKIFLRCVRDCDIRIIKYLIDMKWVTVDQDKIHDEIYKITHSFFHEDNGALEEDNEGALEGALEGEIDNDGEIDNNDDEEDNDEEEEDNDDEEEEEEDLEDNGEDNVEDNVEITSIDILNAAFYRNDESIISLLKKFFKCYNPQKVMYEI